MPGALGRSPGGERLRAPNLPGVAEIPDTIVLRRHRDLKGRHKDVWVRRGLLALVALIPVLALFNVFGQRPGKPTVATSAARLQLYAPTRARGGLLYEARFRITARQELKKAILVLEGEPAGEELVLDGKVVGRITSHAGDRALGYVRTEVPEDAVLEVGGASARLH